MNGIHLLDDTQAGDALQLIQLAFAEQSGRIDPPSSMTTLRVLDIERHLKTEMVWGLADQGHLVACMFGTQQGNTLYLSKLSVHPNARGAGVAGRLMSAAQAYAKVNGFDWLEVIARIELSENHQLFAHLGYEKFAEGRHDGYDRTTEFHFRKRVSTAGSP